MSLIRLAYLSSVAFEITEVSLLDLVSTARITNHKNNITGVLLYGSDVFIQVIEGENKSVMDLFSIIKNDSRHDKVILLFEEMLEKRQFQHWGLRLVRLEETRLDRISEFNLFLNNYKEYNKVNLASLVINEIKKLSAEDL